MAESNIWLKPKPTNIDENFDDFLKYLSEAKDKNSELYVESIRLLKERMNMLIDERYELPVYRHLRDEDTRLFNIRLCGAWLLAIPDADYMERKLVLLTMINNIIQYALITKKTIVNQDSFTYKNLDKFLKMAFGVVTYRLPKELALSWADLRNPSFDIFMSNFLKNEFNQKESSYFKDKGSLFIKDGLIHITPASKQTHENKVLNKAYALNDFVPELGVKVYSDKDDHIKEAKKKDIEFIETCVKNVRSKMRESLPTSTTKILKEYDKGDDVPVKIIAIGEKNFTVRTIDPEYRTIEAKLIFENGNYAFGQIYTFDFWQKLLPVGSVITAYYNEPSKNFNLTDQFLDFLADQYEVEENVDCVYRRPCKGDKSYHEFLSPVGDIILVKLLPEELELVKDGHIVTLNLIQLGDRKFDGLFLGELVLEEKPVIDADSVINDDCLIEPVKEFIYQNQEKISVDLIPADELMISYEILKELCYDLNVVQSRQTDPYVRFRMLSTIILLSVLARFEKEEEYAEYLSKYIKMLILFTTADSDESSFIKIINTPEGLEDEETISQGTDILKILSVFAKDDNAETNALLDRYIDNVEGVNGNSKSLSEVASLVQAYNRLNGKLDVKVLKGIKKQILQNLSVVTEGDSTLELTNELEGPYGVEDDVKEFKESFFEAPKNAKIQNQPFHIMRNICGMMNNRGGTLYLGVSDTGHPKGLSNDLKIFAKYRPGEPKNLDRLCDYISHTGEEYFGETIWKYVSLKPDTEQNIISIVIEPYPYDVVYISPKYAKEAGVQDSEEKLVFLRKNNYTERIKEKSTIEDIRMRRQEASRKTDDKIMKLQDAIQRGVKVRLQDYCSSNRGIISNREVEPFKMIHNEYILAYEPSSSKVKMFKISRCMGVSLSNEKWKFKHLHEILDVDIFNMSGTEYIPVNLLLNVRAKTALCEQYPLAATKLSQVGSDSWLFEAEVHNLNPVMHFYIQYPDSITINSAPGLEEKIKEYIQTNFKF